MAKRKWKTVKEGEENNDEGDYESKQ